MFDIARMCICWCWILHDVMYMHIQHCNVKPILCRVLY